MISSSASALISRLRLSWQSPPDFSLLITQLVQEQPLWLLGVAFMVLGTLSSACGMLLLKRATLGPAPVPPWYKNVWFWAGMSLIVVNASLLDIVAFAVTPLSLIAPFAGLTIVFSVVLVGIGCFGVREKPSTFSVISVGLIVLGVTMAATFGPHEDRALRPADMQVILDGHPGIAELESAANRQLPPQAPPPAPAYTADGENIAVGAEFGTLQVCSPNDLRHIYPSL